MSIIVKTQVRIPAALRDLVEEQARKSGRSMNAEMVRILDEFVRKEGADFSRLNVRMPTAMSERLQKEAATAGRSLNEEIVHRLHQSFEAMGLGDTIAAALLAALNPELHSASGPEITRRLAEKLALGKGQPSDVDVGEMHSNLLYISDETSRRLDARVQPSSPAISGNESKAPRSPTQATSSYIGEQYGEVTLDTPMPQAGPARKNRDSAKVAAKAQAVFARKSDKATRPGGKSTRKI